MLKIISGGQTGVDRAALDVALEIGLPCGGWCPLGRKAEDGVIAECYPLQETASDNYQIRTRKNVFESDGTLIVSVGTPIGGTALTIEYANQLNKPLLVIDLDQSNESSTVATWLEEQEIRVLNVAGPRESQQPGIYARTKHYLTNSL